MACFYSINAKAQTSKEVTHLHKQGTAIQLIVDGKPFLTLCGELGNNTATNLNYMAHVWQKLEATLLNSFLAAVSWAQVEPEEGKFDFSVIDSVIREARHHNLHMGIMWFGSWKKRGFNLYAHMGERKL